MWEWGPPFEPSAAPKPILESSFAPMDENSIIPLTASALRRCSSSLKLIGLESSASATSARY
ncbi:hypothetical protein FOA52_008923 [Chlamydomonas sp. UWO 241]|nr:hypothetical protein FOA52_008923 [Chlamydomonas sp. UWO 241]